MREQVLESDAIEVPAEEELEQPGPAARPLPATIDETSEMTLWGGEVKTAALAAAGGLVAGAATVAVVRATRGAPKRRGRRGIRGRERPQQIVASRSFLVDVHLLGQK